MVFIPKQYYNWFTAVIYPPVSPAFFSIDTLSSIGNERQLCIKVLKKINNKNIMNLKKFN